MWFIVLIVLAVVAFFIIKAFKSRSDSQASLPSETSNAAVGHSPSSDDATAVSATSTEQLADNGSPNDSATSSANSATDASAASAASAASSATAATAATAAAVSAVASSTSSGSGVGPVGSDTGAVVSMAAVDSGNTLNDVREMIKVLNLRSGDASRLSIAREQFDGVWAGDQSAMSADELEGVAQRLRGMLA